MNAFAGVGAPPLEASLQLPNHFSKDTLAIREFGFAGGVARQFLNMPLRVKGVRPETIFWKAGNSFVNMNLLAGLVEAWAKGSPSVTAIVRQWRPPTSGGGTAGQ